MTTTVTDNFTINVAVTGSISIPTLAIRPSLNGNVLSWNGPVGGGPSNGTYIRQSRTLTPSKGVVTTASGQIIQGLNIQSACGADGYASNPCIVVAHNNVVITQCNVLSTAADLKTGDQIMVIINVGVTGTIIEDCYLDLNNRNGGNNSGGTNIVGEPTTGLFVGATFRRNVFTRGEQAISSPANNCSFTENYCTLLGGTDADWVECYPRGKSPGIQNLYVAYNLFDGTDNAQAGADSGVNLTTGSGLPVGSIGPNVLIENNMFANWPQTHPLVADDTNNGAGHTGNLNFGFRNNGFFNCQQPSAGLKGPNSSINPNGGNYVANAPTSTSGTLINGTGTIT